MDFKNFRLNLVFALLFLQACATIDKPLTAVEAPVSRDAQKQAQLEIQKPAKATLKRKIAIGRFTNETRYGRSLLRDSDGDPLGKQVSDMLMSRLVLSGKFLVFERQDLNKLQREQAILAGQSGSKKVVLDSSKKGSDDNNRDVRLEIGTESYENFRLIGVDTLILGSLTEFSRKATGKSGFLSGTKLQTAKAKVEVRLVDPMTGHAFFSAVGDGLSTSESGRVAGFGSKASYDDSLNDSAIASAISDLMGALIDKLNERSWRAEVLKVSGNSVFISAGERQGLKVGDTFSIKKRSETIRSDSGFDIELPPTTVASIKIVGLFGDSEVNEGAVGKIISGVVNGTDGIFVSEE